MPCRRCQAFLPGEEQERVAENFDDDMDGLCFPCAEEVWKERQQGQTMSTTCQDEGD